MGLTKSEIVEIKQRHNLAEMVRASGVELKKNGGRWKGRCPFHEEKTPSFTVDSHRFYCFGCGKSGDIIDYLTEARGLTFQQALETLSPGVVTKQSPQQGLSIMTTSPRTFEERLFDVRCHCPLAQLLVNIVAHRVGHDLMSHLALKIFPADNKSEDLQVVMNIFGLKGEEGRWQALAIWESHAYK